MRSLSAMEQRIIPFSAKNFGVDISDRQAVIDFYWQQKNVLDSKFIQAKDPSFQAGSEAKQLLDDIIDSAHRVSEGSEYDLNTDKFVRIMGEIIDNVATYRYRFCQQKEDLEAHSKRIHAYKREKNYLKDRYYHFLTSELERTTEDKIELVESILNEARFVSSNSQRELGEVEFAHNMSSFIRTLERELSQLQSELAPEKNSKSKKREIEQEPDSLKTLRFE